MWLLAGGFSRESRLGMACQPIRTVYFTYRQVYFDIALVFRGCRMRRDSNDIGLKQRSPLIAFLPLRRRVRSRSSSDGLFAFGLAGSPARSDDGHRSVCRIELLSLPENRRRAPSAHQLPSLGFRLHPRLRGFGVPRVSWLSVWGLLLIPWSLGLIVFSWRYR